jgi:hypothetical protein
MSDGVPKSQQPQMNADERRYRKTLPRPTDENGLLRVVNLSSSRSGSQVIDQQHTHEVQGRNGACFGM